MSNVLARLSVFAGGWMLEQAEAVCADDADDVVETRSIASLLVHKSLVLAEPQGEHTRYRLLEPIRQYAAEKLEETGEADAVRQQHALAYLALTQAAEPHLHAHQQKHWLDRLEREHDNFRAALAWSLSDTGNPDLGLQLAVALWQFWWIRAHLSEGRGWLDALLATASPGASPAARAWVLLGAGIMDMDYHGYYGYPATIKQQLEEALKLFRALGDDAGIALSLRQLSVIAGDMNNSTHDSTYAQSLIEEGLEVARRQHVHPWITTYVLTQLALSRMWQRVDLARAASLSEECLVMARQYGDARVMAVSLVRLADIAGAQLDFERAAELAREALRVTRESGDTFNEMDALRQLADELRFMGEFDQATALIEEMFGISLEHGLADWTGWALTMFGLIVRDQGNYRRAATRYRESIVWYRDKLKKWGNWWNVLSLGTVASAQGQLQRAAKIYGAIDGWQQSIKLLRLSRDQRQFGTYIEATRAELGEAAYATAFEQGRAMTTEQAFQYALSHADEDEPA
jgi:tetratricopeptide (TPR) repeat protein